MLNREDNSMSPRYRFGFVLTTFLGNRTRYLNLRKYADRDPDVECIWAPITNHLDPDPFRRLPHPIRARAIVAREAFPVMRQWRKLDAVMFHTFEPYVWAVMTRSPGYRPAIAWNHDAPYLDPADPRQPPYDFNRSVWRRRLRMRFDLWCARRVDLFVPWSPWVGKILTEEQGIPPERVFPQSVGLDLDIWPYVPRDSGNFFLCKGADKINLLFVGGDFERKGGDMLLSLWRERFRDQANLHLVTRTPPPGLQEEGLFVHTDLSANDERLRRIYAESDVFVLPTRADLSPFVVLEGMATGRPVISSRMAGIPDMINEGETGYLIEPNDPEALNARLEQLVSDPALRARMGIAGRKRVEAEFSSAICVPRILGAMKNAADGLRPIRRPAERSAK